MSKHARIHSIFVILGAGLICSNAALANEAFKDSHISGLDYRYFEAGPLLVNEKGQGSHTGMSLRGSLAWSSHWHVFAGYATHPFDDTANPWARIGVGFNHAIDAESDIVARIAYEHRSAVAKTSAHTTHSKPDLGNIDTPHHPPANRGPSLEIGLRSALVKHIEGQIGLREVFLEHHETLALLGAEYRLNSQWAISADVEIGKESREAFIGARWYF